MNTPTVSVIVPTRNRPYLLKHALTSIAGQRDLPADTVEAIVVNDGGVDVTASLAAADEAGLRVRLVAVPHCRGLPNARNTGLQVARGRYVAFLDDDDVFLPHHLATALDGLDGGGVDAVYTTCVTSPVRVAPTDLLPDNALVEGYPFDADLLSVCNYIPVHTVVMRHPVDALFDRHLPALEDWDFWLRLVRTYGYRFDHVDEPTVVYHRVPDQASMSGSTVNDAAALTDFGTLAQRLWRRWPATTTRAAHFRAYIGVMYWHALGLLATGRPVADLYYQRCLRVLIAAWTGHDTEHGLIDRIRRAVEGEHRAADAA
ncbi:MAG: glycosyltransferase family 2 protein [Stackebrandtia sp.]